VPFVLGHWDNVGFDAPAGTRHDTATHNYRLVNLGTDFMDVSGEAAPAQVNLNIPDQVDGATERRLMFTLQTEANSWYSWSPGDSISVNGTRLPIPEPTSNAQPAIPVDSLVGTFPPYTVVIPLPDKLLVQGENQLVFTTVAGMVDNIHIELDFTAAGEPTYTPPAQAIGGPVAPAIPSVGPNAVITKIGTKDVDKYLEGVDDPAVFNPSVSGIVPIGVDVHQDIAMQSTGNNLGIRQIELLIDKRVVLTQRTDAQAAAPSVITTLNLDTRGLSNGTHEIYLRAYNTRCAPSIADYHGAGADSGAYFPLHIKVQNSGAAMAAAPVLNNHVYLPVATVFNSPAVTCVAAAAQSATPQPFVAFSRDALHDDRRLLICEP
jgi:hypothetical protein